MRAAGDEHQKPAALVPFGSTSALFCPFTGPLLMRRKKAIRQ
jgi:hypothetical protein